MSTRRAISRRAAAGLLASGAMTLPLGMAAGFTPARALSASVSGNESAAKSHAGEGPTTSGGAGSRERSETGDSRDAAGSLDYGDAANWAYWDDAANPASLVGSAGDGTDVQGHAASHGEDASASAKEADLFIVCPTVASGGDAGALTMDLADEDDRASFLGALNMELGIYDEHCRVFAPYYRQATLAAYAEAGEGTALDDTLAFAYEDVRAAFEHYLAARPTGPLVLAGFSQGADLAIRLVRDYGGGDLGDRLIACYALGWRLTQQECDACPWLRAAEEELDTGVVVTFNSEAPEITTSLMVPAGTRTLAINPLSWTTSTDPAPAALNLGACFTNYDGAITREIPQLCGAQIDADRGTLKVSGISPRDYPAGLDLFEDGIYHLYDYQFFYRNLQENVEKRLAAYLEEHGA